MDKEIFDVIQKEAFQRYPSTLKGTKGMIDAGKRAIFIEGASFLYDIITKENDNR